MDALILAGGGQDPADPLYPLLQGKPKALLDIHGKPMVQWVLDAVSGSQQINHIVVVGLDESSGITCRRALSFLPDQGDMISNIIKGGQEAERLNQKPGHCLIIASDIPTITTEMVDWEIETIQDTDYDLYYNLIERSVMEKRFPGSRRSYYRLRDVEICGGDLNAIHTSFTSNLNPVWKKLVKNRKNAFKQAVIIGFDTLFLFAFRLLTTQSAEKWLSRRLKMRGKVILNPYAETGMDVDKPYQLESIRQDIQARTGK